VYFAVPYLSVIGFGLRLNVGILGLYFFTTFTAVTSAASTRSLMVFPPRFLRRV
jgi:hypothetical protein